MFEADELIDKAVCDLSGGELQRVLLSLAVVPVPNLLLLDEPVSGIDKNGMELFFKNIVKLKKNYDLAIILVSHDIGTVLAMVKNIACVNETLHYHSGADISEDWLGDKYACPIELIGHGDLPHRVLKKHEHHHG